MDAKRFDAMTKAWTRIPRRSALRSLGGGAIVATLSCLRQEGASAASCKRLRRSCSPDGKPCCKGNCGYFADHRCCLPNELKCKKGGQCCSTTCTQTAEGKKCRCAPDAQVCGPTAGPFECGTATDGSFCGCTTGSDSTICGQFGPASVCMTCTLDSECDAVTGPGSVCAPVCGCDPPSDPPLQTACHPPCATGTVISAREGHSARRAGGSQALPPRAGRGT